MKAVKITAEREMAVVDLEMQKPQPNEVLLRLEYVGFCGSDLSTYLGKNPMVKMPVIPGHEVGAVVVEVGEDVPDGLKPGMVLTHKTLGKGKLVSIDEGYMTVNINGENKKFKYPDAIKNGFFIIS